MMSNIMNKTMKFAVDALKSKPAMAESGNLISLIQALSAFHNESEVICKFLGQINTYFNSVSSSQQRRYLITIIYCSQFGCNYDSSVKQCLSAMGAAVTTFIERASSIKDKRIGYLALTSLIESCPQDLVYISVNTVLKDIASKHVAIIKMSLDVASHLVNVDLVPVLLPVVERRLSHSDTSVRIKAITTLHCMLRMAPEFMQNTTNHIKLFLSDKNPQVMATSLPYIYNIIKMESSQHKKLPSKLIFILEQVVHGNLPIDMSRHGISAPFVQIQILKILLLFGRNEETKSALSEVLMEMMSRCQNSKHNIAFAVMSECIHTVVSLFAYDDHIFKSAVQHLQRFLNSKQANLLLVGLELLAQVTSVELSCCLQYHNTVLQCLSHPDITIKKQTLVLLQVLITKDNHKVICNHMIGQLKKFDNPFFVKSFSERIASAAEKFSLDRTWLLATLHSVIEAAGENVSTCVCDKLLHHVSEANEDELLAELAHCYELLNGLLSHCHFQTIAWLVGEYACRSDKDVEDITDMLIQQTQRQYLIKGVHCEEIACILLSSVMQIICGKPAANQTLMQKVIENTSMYFQHSPAVYQNLIELEMLSTNQEILDALNQDIGEFDGDFSFLGEFSDECCEEDLVEVEPPSESELKSHPYLTPKQPLVKTSSAFMASLLPQSTPATLGESFLSKKVSEDQPLVWGKSGYMPSQPSSSTNVSLNQALQNLSAVAQTTEEDKAMLDMMNAMLLTSQASSSDVTLTESPLHIFEERN